MKAVTALTSRWGDGVNFGPEDADDEGLGALYPVHFLGVCVGFI